MDDEFDIEKEMIKDAEKALNNCFDENGFVKQHIVDSHNEKNKRGQYGTAN